MDSIAVDKKHWPLLFLQKTNLTLRYGFSEETPEEEVNEMINLIIRDEFNTVQKHLPKTVRKVLDIGCGLGLINLLINRHYGGDEVYYLLDRSDIEESVYSSTHAGNWHEVGGFYSCNKLESTQEILVENGLDPKNLVLVEGSGPQDLAGISDVDLVMSLKSWGFHYPVETYLDKVYEIMSENGTLILDVRKDTGGRELLQETFRIVNEIPSPNPNVKFHCTVCIK